MSYKLCCGSFKHSDLSLAVGKVETEVTCASSSIEEKTSRSNSPIDVHNCDKITGASNIDSADHEGDFIISKERKVKSKTLVPKKKVDVKYKNTKKNGKFWSFRFKRQNKKVIHESLKDKAIPEQDNSCMCTGFKKTKDHAMGPGILFTAETLLNKRSAATASPLTSANRVRLSMGAGPGGPGPSGMGPLPVDLFQLVPAPPQRPSEALIDLSRFNPDDYPTEDVDEIRIAQRAREIEMGLEISPRHVAYPNVLYGGGSPPSTPSTSTLSSSRSSLNTDPMWNLNANFPSQCVVTTINYPQLVHPQPLEAFSRQALQASASNVAPIASASEVVGAESASIYGTVTNLSMPIATPSPYIPQTVHTQVDYMHCLVPDLKNIANCGFYWGVMDRYEAERLLENRPEGTFLLRDSAQEEFLFSVSFRRYGRSLHARIEQWNHKFSFDSHDPGVYAADTVAGLIEHYKDPSSCMFFEPMLTVPLNRTFPFSLQHLCRSVICSNNVYDGIDYLPLPKSMRDYLKYYHYKQKVRVRRFEMHH